MEIEGWIAHWNEQTENKSVPKLWSGLIWWITSTIPNLPAHVSLSFDILSLLSHPHHYTFAHLLANESFHFKLKCHSWQAKAAHQENNKPSDLCLYNQQIKKERTKNYFITGFQHLRIVIRSLPRQDWYCLVKPGKKRVQGQVSVSPVVQAMYFHCFKGVMSVKRVMTWVFHLVIAKVGHRLKRRHTQADNRMWINP